MDMRHLVFRAFEASSRGGRQPAGLADSSVCLSLFLCLPFSLPLSARARPRATTDASGHTADRRGGSAALGRGARGCSGRWHTCTRQAWCTRC